MASLYKKSDSPFWYASVWDSKTQKWGNHKTAFRRDDPAGKRRALIWASGLERAALTERPLLKVEAWGMWVLPWLQATFSYNRGTLTRYENAWTPLYEFLLANNILIPRHLLYRHAQDYLAWRTQQKRRRGTLINHNTAVVELKVMSRIMAEALRRGYCDGNPFYQLGIRRKNVKHTPEMTRDEIEKHREALKNYPRWMQVSFEIALHHGVRLRETQVPMERVHLDPQTTPTHNLDRITFHQKGRNGVVKITTVPLHSALRPLMLELKASKAEFTCKLPPMASKEFWKFRRDHGLAHLRFHSTRATVATELARNNVSIQKAKALLGHSSEAVHLAYLRLKAHDIVDAVETLSFGTPGGQKTVGSQEKSA